MTSALGTDHSTIFAKNIAGSVSSWSITLQKHEKEVFTATFIHSRINYYCGGHHHGLSAI
jgi:hypothetical protein